MKYSTFYARTKPPEVRKNDEIHININMLYLYRAPPKGRAERSQQQPQ